MEKISIIVPIYNVEKYIKKCVESIRNQSYKNIEIILVDDGSTDNSGSIIDSIEKNDSRIKVIHKENGGVSSARNVGIASSTGEYICFVDGDDYVTDDYVNYLYKLISSDKCDVSLSMSFFADYKTKQIKKDKINIISGEEAAINIMHYKILIGANNKMFRKSLLNDKVRFNEELCIGEGFNFNTTAFQLAENVAIGYKKIYFYRKDNATSVTTKFDGEKWENGLYAIELIKESMIIKNKKMENAWHFAKWRTNVDVYNLLIVTNNRQQYPKLYQKCKEVCKKDWVYAFKTKVSLKEKARAITILIFPRLHPFIYYLRKKIFIRR